MTSTLTFIKRWQKALQIEISHLKKFGGTHYLMKNGRLLPNQSPYTYYFETQQNVRVPIGSSVRVQWGSIKVEGRILSAEGQGVIVMIEQSMGDLVEEASLMHDPWELLDLLIDRLEEIKKSKRKRGRIKNLMNPEMEAKHPTEKIKSNVHELVLRSKYNPVTYVWGPPGTGKTYTLARVAANKYIKGKRVLILSHSNQAVDVLMSETKIFIEKKGKFQEGDLLRYGSQMGEIILKHESLTANQLLKRNFPELADKNDQLAEERRLLQKDLSRSFSMRDSEQLLQIETKLARIMEKIRQKEIQFVKDAQVVGTTLAKAAGDPAIYESNFDLVILDEASMAFVPQAAFAASLARRVIICGDFKQLPPIANSNHLLVNEWLKEDIFHHAGMAEWVKRGELHPHLFLLKEQRRMHPDISSFTNKYIYHSFVKDHKSVRELRKEIAAKSPFPQRAAVLLDTSYMGNYCFTGPNNGSRMNPWQLLLAFQCIHEAYLSGNRSIGYVTPYRAQATFMEKLLADLYEKELKTADIIAATVHRFQGSERDVMIFDTVDSYPIERAGMLLTGKESERLINVAITRTKGKFIHISNRSFIHQHVFPSKTLRKLIDHQQQMDQLIASQEIGRWIKNQHPRLRWMHARRNEPIVNDIQSANKEIVISIGNDRDLPMEWIHALNQRNKRVRLTLISSKNVEALQLNDFIEQAFPFPFVCIDHEILWLGVPLNEHSSIRPPYVTVRLDSTVVTEYFLSQIQK
ncbi:AAA domain-containing protein [Bacillus massilinigeriensis]|uniref:AAA domain-containing protein n=1 Tax=Bacillus massilionigeriensis TaxID=1805475 RepID=UPI00096AE326|nr:AAA domain-containing protein [Bacillus massilionigeriensis]